MELSEVEREEILKRIIISLGVGTLAISEADSNAQLYHYTNIEALFNGIIVKDPESDEKAISLFATDSEYLNDYNEIHYGNTQIMDLIKNPESTDFPIVKKVDRYEDICQHYVTSFSRTKDSLPMWSTYGKRGNGIALGFDTVELITHLGLLYPCFYNKKEVRKFLKGLYSYMDEDSHFNSHFKFDTPVKEGYRDGYVHEQLTTLIKHPAYEYEKEIRFVCSSLQVKEINYRCVNNLIVPYTIMYLPKKSLKTIIIGPNLDSCRTKKSILQYLYSKGFKDVEVVESTVPFRD